ncbi:related to protein priB [Fusarium fujikuroi]|nr:related to protein priB [Fusarium fujikuroi]SCN97856.1 related to protein priB [Fusarium fujikuroi]SCO44975.1 related to protein priB [Fusarium fujikuroi]
MAVSRNGSSNTAHVNMMTDSVIANLPPDGLRVIIRSLLASHPDITASFEDATRQYLAQAQTRTSKSQLAALDVGGLEKTQRIARCMLGSGQAFDGVSILERLVIRGVQIALDSPETEKQRVNSLLASLDGDLVQAMTAVTKKLAVSSGARALSPGEHDIIQALFESLAQCQRMLKDTGMDFPYGRGMLTTANILRIDLPESPEGRLNKIPSDITRPLPAKETFQLDDRILPRIFSGLWQMSSPAWGSAQMTEIIDGFSTHVQNGFTAFDMADHYGDAEVLYGRFRSLYPHKDDMFTATKYCVFHPMTVSREAVQANVGERCNRLQQEVIDLLQFHWQLWDNPQYIDALQYLAEDKRVARIGLCNFDTEHLEHVVESGVKIFTNQVQFSLVDSRPTFKMADACSRHDIKLLTYGTLCGGFIADKWLNEPEPDVYDTNITPSQRKYYGMICSWGGWDLFQELLSVLRTVATKHEVNISNIATRWVLDFPYVGAVIIGARIGMSEHTSDNATTLGWSLDDDDRGLIEEVLDRSNRAEMFETMGDCGNEYR